MEPNKPNWKERIRGVLGFAVVASSAAFIVALAAFVIHREPSDGKEIFYTVLPVFASWVGTVLAFYFGQRSFEVAAEQAQRLTKISPEERARTPISSIMRHFRDTTSFKIPRERSEKDIELSELRKKLEGKATRLPIVDADDKPKYMIHASRLDKYVAGGGNESHSLEEFLASSSQPGIGFGQDHAFVVVSRDTAIDDAKTKMEQIPFCQDIFVTSKGTADEPLLGWVSNIRLGKFLEA